MRVSVIISTYNSPAWLENVLWGYAAQSRPPQELVIADDGSGAVTRQRIDAFRAATKLNINHVWHPDDGFRKCAIMNRAITAAEGEYLIFSDGDCIPRLDFVAVHCELARPGRFLSGGLFRLPMNVSERISRGDILAGRACDPRWLRCAGVPASAKLFKLLGGPRLGWLWDRLTTTRATWNGHNASGWKADVLAVNGFDERMAYGGEDRELGERLIFSGVRPIQIRHRAICVHLDHARGYVSDAAWARNRAIWNETLRTRSRWTEYGMQRVLAEEIDHAEQRRSHAA